MPAARPFLLCPLSAAGYLHVGSLRRLVAAHDFANETGGELHIRINDHWSAWEAPPVTLRNAMNASGAPHAIGYLRRCLELCGLGHLPVSRLSDVLGAVTDRYATQLMELIDRIVTPGEFAGSLVADGFSHDVARNITADAVGPIRRTEIDGHSTLLMDDRGILGPEIASLLASIDMGATHIFLPDPCTTEVELLRRLSSANRRLAISECVPVPNITLDGDALDQDGEWIGAFSEPALSVTRIASEYGTEPLLLALRNSLSEGIDAWETICTRWLPRLRSRLAAVPRHLRYRQPEADPGVSPDLTSATGCPCPMQTRPKVRFAPSASGHLHVGNLRTMIAARDLADELGGELVVRIDDYHVFFWHYIRDCDLIRTLKQHGEKACCIHHIRRGLEACEIPYDDEYLLSETVPDVTAAFGPTLPAIANGFLTLRECFRGGTESMAFARMCADLGLREDQPFVWQFWAPGLRYRSEYHIMRLDGLPSPHVVAVASDALRGVTHAARGVDIEYVVDMEDTLIGVLPGAQRVQTHLLPLLRWNGRPISKSVYGAKREPEVSVARQIELHGAERLNQALRLSLSHGVDDWEEIQRRWLRQPSVPVR